MKRWIYGTAVLAAVFCATARPAIGGVFIGSVMGRFENPVRAGNIIRFTGPEFFDNTASAVVSIANGPTVSVLSWGIPAGGIGTASPGALSFISFAGNPDVDVASGEVFDIGTIQFFNTFNTLESVIFGADLVIEIDDPTVDPIAVHMEIITTENSLGGVPGADLVRFDQPPLDVGAFELFGVVATLRGAIVGDPFFQLTDIVLSPSAVLRYDPSRDVLEELPFPSDLVGFVRTSPIPEPSTLLLALSGVAVVGGRWLRRRRDALKPAGRESDCCSNLLRPL